jgi:hypothetical protein
MPILTFLAIRFSERDFWVFLERWYQIIHIVITPPNPHAQVLRGEFPIYVKGTNADPLENIEYMRSYYERKRGVPHLRLCLAFALLQTALEASGIHSPRMS